MGDPRKLKKKYARPKVKYDKDRILDEKRLKVKYGLKNKKEIWKAEKEVKRIRNLAKKLITASADEQKQFLGRLAKQGLIQANTVDDVLELKTENVLSRRLQTVVATKFNLKPRKARQVIVHGHVMLEGRKVNIPSFFVNLDSEKKIFYNKK